LNGWKVATFLLSPCVAESSHTFPSIHKFPTFRRGIRRPSKPQAKISPANNTQKLAVNQGAVAPNHLIFFSSLPPSNHNDRTHKYDRAKINSLPSITTYSDIGGETVVCRPRLLDSSHTEIVYIYIYLYIRTNISTRSSSESSVCGIRYSLYVYMPV